MNLHGGYMLDLAWLLKSWCFHFSIVPACLLEPELGEHHFLRTASNIRIHYVAKGDTGKPLMLCMHRFPEVMYTCFYCLVRYCYCHFSRWAVYKSGTGTRGRGHRDACVGTWDLGTRDEGLEDIKYGTWGRVGRGRGIWIIIANVGGKCDISFFVKMCYLWSTLDSIFQNHIGHLMMFTQNISL